MICWSVQAFVVVAEVEDALHKAGGVPPAAQVPEQRGLARAAHAAHQQDVAFRQQALLDLQDVEVAAYKAVGAVRAGCTFSSALLSNQAALSWRCELARL